VSLCVCMRPERYDWRVNLIFCVVMLVGAFVVPIRHPAARADLCIELGRSLSSPRQGWCACLFMCACVCMYMCSTWKGRDSPPRRRSYVSGCGASLVCDLHSLVRSVLLMDCQRPSNREFYRCSSSGAVSCAVRCVSYMVACSRQRLAAARCCCCCCCVLWFQCVSYMVTSGSAGTLLVLVLVLRVPCGVRCVSYMVACTWQRLAALHYVKSNRLIGGDEEHVS
jgi:hypothetical protein